MAVGDIISDTDNVPASSSIDFQPAVGVEILITGVAHDSSSTVTQMQFMLVDGIVNSAIFQMNVSTSAVSQTPSALKIGITNTLYLRRQNIDSAGRGMAYTGIQIK